MSKDPEEPGQLPSDGQHDGLVAPSHHDRVHVETGQQGEEECPAFSALLYAASRENDNDPDIQEEEPLMYSLFRLLPLRRLLQEQVPALGVSFIVAELFYKFHSFTLETLAFLATWGLVDAIIQASRHVLRDASDSALEGSGR